MTQEAFLNRSCVVGGLFSCNWRRVAECFGRENRLTQIFCDPEIYKSKLRQRVLVAACDELQFGFGI